MIRNLTRIYIHRGTKKYGTAGFRVVFRRWDDRVKIKEYRTYQGVRCSITYWDRDASVDWYRAGCPEIKPWDDSDVLQYEEA